MNQLNDPLCVCGKVSFYFPAGQELPTDAGGAFKYVRQSFSQIRYCISKLAGPRALKVLLQPSAQHV